VIARSSGTDHRDAIAERRRAYQLLFRLPRYRLRPEGNRQVQDPVIPRPNAGRPSRSDDGVERNESRRKQDTTGRMLAAMIAASGKPAEEVEPPEADLPEVMWVSLSDGTRAPGMLDDRAAEYISE